MRAVAGQVLMKGDGEATVVQGIIKMYRSANVTCMFMMQRSCPDILNAVQRLARHMTAPREAHVGALMTRVKYLMHTKNRDLILAPGELLRSGYKFKIHG